MSLSGRRKLDPHLRIAFVQGPNPKRKNTLSGKRFEQYRVAKTIGDALSLGAMPSDLKFDREHGFMRLLTSDELHPVENQKGAPPPPQLAVLAVTRRSFARRPLEDISPSPKVEAHCARPCPAIPSVKHPACEFQFAKCDPTQSVHGPVLQKPRISSVRSSGVHKAAGALIAERQKRARERLRQDTHFRRAARPQEPLDDHIVESPETQTPPRHGELVVLSSPPSPVDPHVCVRSAGQHPIRKLDPVHPTPASSAASSPQSFELPRFNASEIASLIGLNKHSESMHALVRVWGRNHKISFKRWERQTGGVALPEFVFARHASASVHAAVGVAIRAGDGAMTSEASARIVAAVEASGVSSELRASVCEEAFKRARCARGTRLEHTGLGAYETAYGRSVVRRNQDSLRGQYGSGSTAFILQGRIDGFELEPGGRRVVVEHKRRQRKLFQEVPVYEQVQCQAYMAMTTSDACRWVQSMGTELSVRTLVQCPSRWRCIQERLANTARLLRSLICGSLVPLCAAELQAFQRQGWECAPWPAGNFPEEPALLRIVGMADNEDSSVVSVVPQVESEIPVVVGGGAKGRDSPIVLGGDSPLIVGTIGPSHGIARNLTTSSNPELLCDSREHRDAETLCTSDLGVGIAELALRSTITKTTPHEASTLKDGDDGIKESAAEHGADFAMSLDREVWNHGVLGVQVSRRRVSITANELTPTSAKRRKLARRETDTHQAVSTTPCRLPRSPAPTELDESECETEEDVLYASVNATLLDSVTMSIEW